FPKPCESEHDAFIGGHASNSISVALGMAHARTLRHEDYHVLALIGDGALTGGLAYEGLNGAGASGEKLIVIINDNGISILPNVGAMSEYLARLRSRPSYYHFKKIYRRIFGGSGLYRFNHRLKSQLKKAFFPGSTVFENMGFTYLGPVDGHDLERLCSVLEWAKELDGPVVIHVKTQKGKGIAYAEREPDKYHGVSAFDPQNGEANGAHAETFSEVFGAALCEYAKDEPRICAVTAAMADGTGLTGFSKTYPERFFDAAIAEGHAVSMCAGMAKQGMIPVFAVYSTFLQRAYDMLMHDAALQKLHVVLAVDRAGLVGADGETHHGTLDVSFLTAIPNFTVLCPASFAELRSMLRRALFEESGPVAVRYPRGGEGTYREDRSAEALTCLREGTDAALVAYGVQINTALDAAKILAARGVSAKVVKLNQIAPLDASAVLDALGEVTLVAVVEDCFENGSVGERIAAMDACAAERPARRFVLCNMKESFAPAGSVSELEARLGLDAQSVANAVGEALSHEQ
ncbi:MAG: 1-deoxy-D-xylulose-5-phosphate synthase, partial [Oscillibacter sp.]|nr:1-deoxy-D-xylulose-5-phosphate synthase [Oscillibacter sp.]